MKLSIFDHLWPTKTAMIQPNTWRGKDMKAYISTITVVVYGNGSELSAQGDISIMWILYNLYNVNYICITYILKTRVKFTFDNERRK